MPRAFLAWVESDRMRIGAIPERGEAIVGRTADAQIVVPGETVSRRHASVRSDGNGFVIENLSSTNVTQMNGAAISAPTPVKNGDRVSFGNTIAEFHDLAAMDRVGDLTCSHCTRANAVSRSECWFCGTSLVNAPTVRLAKRAVVCRAMSAGGESHDLFDGDVLLLRGHGQGEVIEGAADQRRDEPAVVARDGHASLESGSAGRGVVVNGEAPAAGQPLTSGDEIRVGEQAFVVAIR